MARRRHHVDPEFGATLRRLRLDCAYSFRDVAELAKYGKSYLHQLETGERLPTPEAAAKLDDVLHAGGKLAAMVTVVGSGNIPRRDFVARAGLAAALPYIAPLAMGVGGRRIGAQFVTQLHHRTARLRRLDNILGGADTVAVYRAEYDGTAQAIRTATFTERTRSALLGLLGEQAQMAGWAAFDAGLTEEAERFYRLSLAAADEADDKALAANAFAFLAYQAPAGGRQAVALAERACEIAGSDTTPLVRALLTLRRAWAHAVADEVDATKRWLDVAEAALVDHDPRPEPDWTFWIDRTELKIMTGRCWSVLRRPARATVALETAMAAYADTHARDKALYLSWLADAYLDANEVERACETAVSTMNLSAGVGSVRPRQRVSALVNRIEPHRELPEAAETLALARDWLSSARQLPA